MNEVIEVKKEVRNSGQSHDFQLQGNIVHEVVNDCRATKSANTLISNIMVFIQDNGFPAPSYTTCYYQTSEAKSSTYDYPIDIGMNIDSTSIHQILHVQETISRCQKFGGFLLDDVARSGRKHSTSCKYLGLNQPKRSVWLFRRQS